MNGPVRNRAVWCRGVLPRSGKLVFELTDPASGLDAAIQLAIEPGGVISAQASVTNTGTDDYHLEEMTLAFPVPLEATEVLDVHGPLG